MSADDELLKPAREHLAHLDALIAKAELEMMEKIGRFGHDDAEYAYQHSKEYHLSVEPLRREREAVIKTMTDYYAAQPLPQFIAPGQSAPGS